MKKYQNRQEVPEKYKWDLTDIFKDEADFNKNFKLVEETYPKFESYKGCTKNSDKLYEFLVLENDLGNILEKLYVYSFLINDQELGVAKSIERKSRTSNIYTKVNQSLSFFAPELLKLTKEEYDSLFLNKKLNKYKASLDRIYRDKDHILSENEEKIISELTNSMDDFDDISSNLISKEHDYGKVKLDDGTTETIATNNYRLLMRNSNRDVRRKTYNSFNKKLDQYSGTSASLLNSFVKEQNSIAKLRNFSDSWEKRLFNLNLDNSVFENLTRTVENNVKSIQNYIALKKKILGYNKIYAYDLSVELIDNKKEYSIEDAQELTLKALSPLKEDYLSKFKKIFDNHYIDYCQYKGKCSGAYSFSTSTTDSKILMSYNNNLSSVSTIIHEGGHNVHHQYLKEFNESQYRSQSNIACEVASLTNECLLSDYLYKYGTTKEERLAGLGNIIDVLISNLFGAVREGKVEQEMYDIVSNGGCLTKDILDKLVTDSYKKYYGKSVVIDKNLKNSWVTRSHYFMNYYLYSYAISISVATNVADRIIAGDEDMLNKYIKFLSTGCDKWPKEAFDILGIDINDKCVYENAIKYFDDLLLKYESLYNEGKMN